MIDIKPNYFGEGTVWEAFKENLPNNAVIYNGREINGREFDFCVLLENKGILIVEVKGWSPSKVKVLGPDNIIVEGFPDPLTSPKKQANAYRYAMVNRIKDRYKANPVVFDMVCYPFISRKEFYDLRLEIVCEEEFVLFKEDLLSAEQLTKKIDHAFGKISFGVRDFFGKELMTKVRNLFEPEIIETLSSQDRAYSKTEAFPDSITDDDLNGILESYFSGTKFVIFFNDFDSFKKLCEAIEKRLKNYGIKNAGNNLEFGEPSSFASFVAKKELKIFNFEAYFVDRNSCELVRMSVIEGDVDNQNMSLLERLDQITSFNLSQYRIEHSDSNKNILVEAGAGTGKTFSMISRISYLCNKQKDPVIDLDKEIVMVTFTNDAAYNMKKRLKQLFINYSVLTSNNKYHSYISAVDTANISTIHKYTIELLRKLTLYTGLGAQFKISEDQYVRGKKYDAHLDSFINKKIDEDSGFTNTISVQLYDLKDKLMKMARVLLTKSVDIQSIDDSSLGTASDYIPFFNELITDVIIPAEKDYFDYMHSTNRIDLVECIILLNSVVKNGLINSLPDNTVKYLFIDEFQDTDDVQIDLFKRLQMMIGDNCKVFIVGDLKQSIYRFRGAKLTAFARKNEFVGEWKNYYLTKNYRTDSRLLDKYDVVFAAMGENNYLPYSNNDRLVGVKQFETEEDDIFKGIQVHGKEEEAFYDSVFDSVKLQMHNIIEIGKTRALSREERTIAILVRKNYQVSKIVLEGAKREINVKESGGGDLFRLPSTHDTFKLLLALKNNKNPLHLLNLIESNYVAADINYLAMNAMDEKEKLAYLTKFLNTYFKSVLDMSWDAFVMLAHNKPILYVLKKAYDGLKPWAQYSENVMKQREYMVNYECLIEAILGTGKFDIQTLKSVSEYLRVNIVTGQERESRELFDTKENAVNVVCMTIHKSKGLEYGTIVLPYTSEDISDPNKEKLEANYSEDKLSYLIKFRNKGIEHNSYYDHEQQIGEQISEESRVLYVALTRAIRNCIWFNNIDASPKECWAYQLEVE